VQQVFAAVGKRGKWVLPLGLLAALAFPQFASLMQVAIAPLLVVLLVISFLQLNESSQSSPFFNVQLFGTRFSGRQSANKRSVRSWWVHTWSAELTRTLLLLLGIQLVLPIVVLLIMRVLSVPVAWQVPITLVGAASFITGGPSIVMMLGGNGGAAIRLLVISTLALPITAFPVLALLPLHSSHIMLVKTAIVLALVVLGALIVARLLRKYVLSAYNVKQRQVLDGLSAIVLAFIVLGLMAAIHTAWDQPDLLLKTLFWACVINFAYQVLGLGLNHLFSMKLPIVLGVMTGNRAVAIFLTALPASTYQPFLLFIACYQIPMYLTPLLGNYVYRRYTQNAI